MPWVLLNLANLCKSRTTRQTVFAVRTWSKSDSARHSGCKTLSIWHICRIMSPSSEAYSRLLLFKAVTTWLCAQWWGSAVIVSLRLNTECVTQYRNYDSVYLSLRANALTYNKVYIYSNQTTFTYMTTHWARNLLIFIY